MRKTILILFLLVIAYLYFAGKAKRDRFNFTQEPDFVDRSEQLQRQNEESHP